MNIPAHIKLLRQSTYSGLRRWECSAKLTELVLEFVAYDLTRIRKGKLDNRKLRFSTGGGYNWVDQDLLGGSGDSLTEREFVAWLTSRGITL